MSPLNLNPAETGMFDGEFRLTANNRNQWKSITVPYRTFAASFDWNSMDKIVPVGTAGTGLQFMNDVAGDGNFSTTIIKWSAAWAYPINDSLKIGLGFNINYNQHSIDFTKFYFGSQYNGYSYDPNLPTSENFPAERFSYVDLTLGAYFHYILKNGIPLSGGIAFNHLNQPDQSFYTDDPNQLAMKFNFDIKSIIPLKKDIAFLPSIAFYRQGKLMETYYGGLFRLTTRYSNVRNIFFGGWFRHGDAGIIKLGFDYQNFNVGFSYDMNFSSLKVVSRGLGGPEIGIIYIFNTPKPVPIPGKKTCPVYL
jgi:type IX secretion system PorP/SprF family membrane protein